jgi:hypothetical protein
MGGDALNINFGGSRTSSTSQLKSFVDKPTRAMEHCSEVIEFSGAAIHYFGKEQRSWRTNPVQ